MRKTNIINIENIFSRIITPCCRKVLRISNFRLAIWIFGFISAFFIILFLLQGCLFLKGNIYPDGDCLTEPDESVPKIILYGDSRTQADIHKNLVDLMQAYTPVAVFHTGDMVENGSNQSQWNEFTSIVDPFLSKGIFYPSLGNHDLGSTIYFEIFNNIVHGSGWYSVDIQNIHFIILDSNTDISIDSPQYTWLLTDLQKNTMPENFTVAIFHHPVFNVGEHAPDQKGFMDKIVPLFEQYDIDVIFSGHDHNYQRFFYNGIFYLITGGGGAPLYRRTSSSPYLEAFVSRYHFCVIYITRSKLYVKAIDDNGEQFDCFEINP